MTYIGDFRTGKTIRHFWSTNAVAGESITRATDGSIRVYKDSSDTQRSSSAGITDTEDVDSLTGVHRLTIDLSDNTDSGFYAAGSDYNVVLVAATIDGKTINAPLFSFSIENRSALMPTTDGRKLDITANGNAGIDWGNVDNVTSTLNFTGTTWAWNSSWDAEVQSECADALNAYDGPTFTEMDNAFATVNNTLGTPVADLSTDIAAIKSETAAILDDTGTSGVLVANGAITASTLAANCITSSELDSTAITEIQGSMPTVLAALASYAAVNADTLESATGTTAVLGSSANDSNNGFYNGCLLLLTGGPGAGQVRPIEDYVGATQTATVSTWTVTPDNTTTYAILPATTASGGGGLDAAGVRAAIGMSSANLDTQLGTIDTNVDSILADTNELQVDWVNGGRLDLIIDAINAKTTNLPSSPAAVGSAMTLSSGAITTSTFGSGAINAAAVAADVTAEIFGTALTEAYATDGSAATAAQLLYMILSVVSQFDISGTTITTRKLDGTTSAMTYTMDDDTNPTSRSRAS